MGLGAFVKRNGLVFARGVRPQSCDFLAKTGHMVPAAVRAKMRYHDTVYAGTAGSPGAPDHVPLSGPPASKTSRRFNPSLVGLCLSALALANERRTRETSWNQSMISEEGKMKLGLI